MVSDWLVVAVACRIVLLYCRGADLTVVLLLSLQKDSRQAHDNQTLLYHVGEREGRKRRKTRTDFGRIVPMIRYFPSVERLRHIMNNRTRTLNQQRVVAQESFLPRLLSLRRSRLPAPALSLLPRRITCRPLQKNVILLSNSTTLYMGLAEGDFWDMGSDATTVLHGCVNLKSSTPVLPYGCLAFVGYCVQSNFVFPWPQQHMDGSGSPATSAPSAQSNNGMYAIPEAAAKWQIFGLIVLLEIWDETGGGTLSSLPERTSTRKVLYPSSAQAFRDDVHLLCPY
jgi:hypothetical protein